MRRSTLAALAVIASATAHAEERSDYFLTLGVGYMVSTDQQRETPNPIGVLEFGYEHVVERPMPQCSAK